MQPAPQQQLVALGSHQAAPKRLLEPLQQQQHAASANGVQQLLKAVSMGATLVGGSSGQPALFTIAPGMPPQASSLGQQQQQQQQGQLAALGLAAHQGASFVQQGHQAATPVGVVVASRGTHAQLVNGPTGATAQVNSAQQIFLAAPQSTQLLLPSPPSAAAGMLGPLLPLTAGGSQQVVQVVAANGTVLTTTLANLPALSQQLSLAAALAGPPKQQHFAATGHVTVAAQQQQQQQQLHQQMQMQQQQQLFAPGGYAALAGPPGSGPPPPGVAAAMPQLYANINGQLVAVSPQVVSQPMQQQQQLLQLLQPPQGLPVSFLLSPAAPPQVELEAPPQGTEILGTGSPPDQLQAISHAAACPEAPTLTPSPPVSMVPAASGLAGCPPVVSIAPASFAPPVSSVTGVPVTSTPTSGVPASSTVAGSPEATVGGGSGSVVDGIDLEEIKHFAKAFKLRRLSLGLTQTQVGLALTSSEGPSYSQSAICRFEKLDITPKSAQKIKPVLERWMREAEERLQSGGSHALADLVGGGVGGAEPAKKRKQRTSFTPQALQVLNRFFEASTHPTGAEMTELAEQLNYDREVVRVWFCNKRQAFKNTVKRLKADLLRPGQEGVGEEDLLCNTPGSAPAGEEGEEEEGANL
ncbi:uncharacterized protein LOC144168784 isoform X4 [Haemaphysalis longicornis]